MKTKKRKISIGSGEKNVIFFADAIPRANYEMDIACMCIALGFYEIENYVAMIERFKDVPSIGKIFSKQFGRTTYHAVFVSENGVFNSENARFIANALSEKFGNSESPIAVIVGRRTPMEAIFESLPKEKFNYYRLSL